VFVDSVIPGRIQAFEKVESDVKTAWLGDQKTQAIETAYKAMRAKYTKYTVLLPAAPARATASVGQASPQNDDRTRGMGF
jgi:hypothetical protein